MRTKTQLIDGKIIKKRQQHGGYHAVGMKTLCFVHGVVDGYELRL
jgi:hypothetical protein